MDRDTKKLYLAEKYAGLGFETATRLHAGDARFFRVLDELDELDPDFTKSWLDHVYGRIYNRNKLDERTRALVVIGQDVVSGADYHFALPIHIHEALKAGATKEEILEVILHAHVYSGIPKMVNALRIFRRFMKENGLWDLKESPFTDTT